MVRRVLAFAKWVQTKLSGRRAGYHLCRMVTPLHEPSRLATLTFFADLLRTADVWQSAERDGGGKSKGTHLPTMPCALCRQEDGPVPTRLEAFETDYPPCPQRADPLSGVSPLWLWREVHPRRIFEFSGGGRLRGGRVDGLMSSRICRLSCAYPRRMLGELA